MPRPKHAVPRRPGVLQTAVTEVTWIVGIVLGLYVLAWSAQQLTEVW